MEHPYNSSKYSIIMHFPNWLVNFMFGGENAAGVDMI